MPLSDEDVIIGDGEKENAEGEGQDESVNSDVSSYCSEIAAIAEYDVIDFLIKTPHSTHTRTNPLRGAGRGVRRGPLDTRRHRNRDRDRDRDNDRKKRGKMNVGLERIEKLRNEDRDKDIGRGRKSQGEGQAEGEGEEEGAGRSDYSVSESFESRSLSLSGLDKPLYLHSSPLLALCFADHVRHHTDFR
jgi:hypothetical protein